ncbi:MAG TPA: ABC transporter ATP-binding protein [Chloroflexi bacterium]|nr:ABC transporter ATP-binding protein [Chloroflexota bacterium]
MPTISISNVRKAFGDVQALDGISFEVNSGEVFGLLGHNGAGKTTTVRLLNGVLFPSHGQARVLGLDPTTDGPALRRRTGVLTETPSLDERLTARDNLLIYADLYDVPPSKLGRRVDEMLEQFELTDRADDKVGAYSKGMKQRLALARALLHRPEILFLDEPTAGLDPVVARQVHDLITRLSRREGRTVLLCTHNLVEAQQLCDRVAVLEHGRLVALGAPDELARGLVHRLPVEFEVAPDETAAALAALQTLDTNALARRDGRLTAQLDRDAIPVTVEVLLQAGVHIYRVNPQQPTLEDVYFTLHRKENGV